MNDGLDVLKNVCTVLVGHHNIIVQTWCNKMKVAYVNTHTV